MTTNGNIFKTTNLERRRLHDVTHTSPYDHYRGFDLGSKCTIKINEGGKKV